MKILFESDSLIQFLIATHLRTTVFKNDDADLLMYDSMPNARRIYENIKKTGLYTNCYLVTSVLAVGRTKLNSFQKAQKFFKWIEMISFPKIAVKDNIVFESYRYDELIFCANSIFLDGLFSILKKENPNIKCYRYEGSLTSYIHDHENFKGKKRVFIERVIKNIFKNYDLEGTVEKYYFFEPQLIQFKHNYTIEKMEKITSINKDVLDLLNNIFEFDPNKNHIKEKYIAFEDGNLFFMNNDEEVDLYSRIPKIIDKDNFIIKLHPRTGKNRFEDKDVKTNVSVAPWEIYLLNQKMDEKVLITCASGSIFTSLIYFGANVSVYMLYKCIGEKIPLINDNFEKLFSEIENSYGKNVIKRPETREEFYSLLKKER